MQRNRKKVAPSKADEMLTDLPENKTDSSGGNFVEREEEQRTQSDVRSSPVLDAGSPNTSPFAPSHKFPQFERPSVSAFSRIDLEAYCLSNSATISFLFLLLNLQRRPDVVSLLHEMDLRELARFLPDKKSANTDAMLRNALFRQQPSEETKNSVVGTPVDMSPMLHQVPSPQASSSVGPLSLSASEGLHKFNLNAEPVTTPVSIHSSPRQQLSPKRLNAG